MNGNGTDRSPTIESERLILYPISDAEMAELIARERDPELKQAYAEMLREGLYDGGCQGDLRVGAFAGGRDARGGRDRAG